jgi:hypothetical protein
MWEIPLAPKDIIVPLVSGVIGAFVGGWATVFFQRKSERKRHAEKTLFDVYMMLMDLKGRHFWITSAEVQGKESGQQIREKFQDIRWRIADEIRKIDYLPEAEDILRVMFALTYRSEGGRADEFDRLLKALGKKINSRYDRVMAEITRENQALMVRDADEFFRRQKKIEPL